MILSMSAKLHALRNAILPFSLFLRSLFLPPLLAPVLTWFAELANFRQSFIQGLILWKELFPMTGSSQLIFRDQF